MQKLTDKQIIELQNDGYIFFEELLPNTSTIDIARGIGKIQPISNVPTVQKLIPRNKSESTSNVYSGIYGLEEFPLYSDLSHWATPPRYLMLRCIIPTKNVYTFVASFEKMVEKEIKINVIRALFKPRKRASKNLSLLRFYEKEFGIEKYRWDNVFITPENKEAEIISKSLKNYSPSKIENKIFYKNPGDTLVVDNWKILHGRSKVPKSSKNRLIERIYLSEIYN